MDENSSASVVQGSYGETSGTSGLGNEIAEESDEESSSPVVISDELIEKLKDIVYNNSMDELRVKVEEGTASDEEKQILEEYGNDMAKLRKCLKKFVKQ